MIAYCNHVLWPSVDIGARVDEHENVVFRGEVRGDAGALDALERAKLDRGARDHRASMAGAHDGVGLTAFDQIDRAAHRESFFRRIASTGLFVHLDDLRGMDDFDARVAAVVLLQLPLHCSLITRQKELPDFRILLQRHDRSGDSIARGIIAAHGVEGDPHEGTIPRPR